jgi:multicomponent Na+:H+ antiporter subunit C
MSAALPYVAAAFALFSLGLAGLLLSPEPLRKLISANVMGLGALMLLVAFAWRSGGPPDPTPHALVITGIVVAVAATALGLALIRRMAESELSDTESVEAKVADPYDRGSTPSDPAETATRQ